MKMDSNDSTVSKAISVIHTRAEVMPPDFTAEFSLRNPKQEAFSSPRQIFIFLDGTWNEERAPWGKVIPTNVLRMFQELNHKTVHELRSLPEGKNSTEIIGHYYRGVGSRQDNNVVDRKWFGFNGKDEERIRGAAFADLYRDYTNNNDRIYILGFSRGAASARLLARDICISGLPPRLRVHTTHFPNLLTGQIEARVDRVERLHDDPTGEKNHRPKVAFLGCWDTVDAFVLPSRFPTQGLMDKGVRMLKSSIPALLGKERFKGEENGIPEGVLKAVHCVAIDETRHAFLPSLMPHADNVEEVWFPGVHSDIGGGYNDSGLAQAPYEFMKKQLIAAADLGNQNLFKISERPSFSSEFCFHFHGLNTGLKRAMNVFGFGTSIRSIRVLDAKDGVKPKIHDSLNKVMTSDSVYAADTRDKRTWTITYDPYNVRELRQEFDVVSD